MPRDLIWPLRCFDGHVRLYDLASLKVEGVSSPQRISPAAKIRSPGGDRPDGLAFSPDGIHLAVGFNLSPKVDVLRVKGNALEYEYSPDVTGVKGGPGTDLQNGRMVTGWEILIRGRGLRQ